MSIHVIGPDDGEQSGGGPIRCRIIEDGSRTQHRLGLIEAVVPPGPGGASGAVDTTMISASPEPR